MPTGGRRVVIVSHQRDGPTIFTLGIRGALPAGLTTWSLYSAPTLLLADDAGGPTSGRTMKSGVSIVNSTPVLNAGGRLFVLNSDQRFFFGAAPSAFTAAMFDTFCDEVVAHPKAREFASASFIKPHSFHCHVTDPVNYERYSDWHGTRTIDQYGAGFAIWPGLTPVERGMSTLIIVFESPVSDQTITVSGRSSWYTRWPLNTVLGQSMRSTPTSSAEHLNNAIHRGEADAHEPAYHDEYF